MFDDSRWAELRIGRLLGLPAGYHQARTGDHQNGANNGGDLLVVFGGDPDVCVSEVDAVMFRAGDGNKERNDPENRQQYSTQKQNFHRALQTSSLLGT